jgi:hypothetical protein
VVGGLASLRSLALGHFEAAEDCGLRMEAVRKLSGLEALELGYSLWEGEALELLVPPPERLVKVTLALYQLRPLPWEGALVEQLDSYGVDVHNPYQDKAAARMHGSAVGILLPLEEA